VTTTDLPARIGRTIAELALLKPGDRVIVALSGGADSTALLRLLASLPDLPLDLVAAHLNHCLRGAESDADELDVPFECRRVDVRAVAVERGLNLEDAGRRLRYDFLEDLRRSWQARAIALAHHADDQAETVLMRLLRGSGVTGLSGMAHRNGRRCVRPLLGITRAEIEAYLIGLGQGWRDDSSNLDASFLRNRIRHELLPLLEQYNPAVRRRLAVTAGLLADEDCLLEQLAAEAAAGDWHEVPFGMACSIEQLKTQPLPLQRRMVRQILARLAGSLEQFSHRHIQAILDLAGSQRPNARVRLPRGMSAVREYGLLLLTSGEPLIEAEESQVEGTGRHELAGKVALEIELLDTLPEFRENAVDTACFDLDKAPFPWLVRTFRPGDRIRPLGMSGSRKVKDLFIDEKVPFSRRRRIPLLFSGNELIWVAGLRRSHLSAIDSSSTRIARVVLRGVGER